jgi:hypothetical protein
MSFSVSRQSRRCARLQIRQQNNEFKLLMFLHHLGLKEFFGGGGRWS